MDRPDIQRIANLASLSNDELGAIGERLVDYHTGKWIDGFDKDTALFVASARTIVEMLIEYIHYLESRDRHFADMTATIYANLRNTQVTSVDDDTAVSDGA